jgi:hypothetical protein
VARVTEDARDRVAIRPLRAEATVTGPVGLAETISTCTRSTGSANPPP